MKNIAKTSIFFFIFVVSLLLNFYGWKRYFSLLGISGSIVKTGFRVDENLKITEIEPQMDSFPIGMIEVGDSIISIAGITINDKDEYHAVRDSAYVPGDVIHLCLARGDSTFHVYYRSRALDFTHIIKYGGIFWILEPAFLLLVLLFSIIALIVFLADRKSLQNTLISGAMLAFLLYLNCIQVIPNIIPLVFGEYTNHIYVLPLFICTALYFLSIAAYFALFMSFVILFPQQKLKLTWFLRAMYIIAFLLPAIAYITFCFSIDIDNAVDTAFRYYDNAEYIVFLLSATIIIAIAIKLFQIRNRFQRSKAIVILLMIAIGTAISMASQFFTQSWYVFYTYRAGFFIILLGFIYPIWRDRLFGTGVIINRSLTYAFILIILSALFIVFGEVFEELNLVGENLPIHIGAVVNALLASIFILPAQKVSEIIVNRLFFKKKIAFQRNLNALSRELHFAIDMESLEETALSKIAQFCELEKLSLFYFMTNGDFMNTENIGLENLEENAIVVPASAPSILAIYATRKYFFSLTRVDFNIFADFKDELTQFVERWQFDTLVAFYFGARLTGFLLMRRKNQRDYFDRDEAQLLQSFADKLAFALEVVRLHRAP